MTDQPATRLPPPLRARTMFFYSLGQSAEGIQSAAFNTLLLFYYQQIIGLSGTLTGLALAIALVADAVTDPVAGGLSDRARTGIGRRHPFMLAAMLPLAITFVMLFNPPEGLSSAGYFTWLVTFAILVRASLTFHHIPHLALGAELSDSSVTRSSLFNLGALQRMGGEGIVPFIAYVFFFPTTDDFSPGTLNADGYLPFSIFFAIWMALAILATTIGTWHRIPALRDVPHNPGSRWHSGYSEILNALRNSAFRTLFIFIVIFALINATVGVLSPFMAFHFWELTTETLAIILVCAAPAVIPSLFLVPWLTRRFDKRDILVATSVWLLIITSWAIMCRLLNVPWFPANDSVLVPVIICVNTAAVAMALPVFIATGDAMIADIADEIELETGHRREGVLFAARAFAGKATGSLGLLTGGFLLDIINFPEYAETGTVSGNTLWWLGFAAGPATSVLLLVSLVLLVNYPLTRSRYREIQAALKAQSTAGANDAP